MKKLLFTGASGFLGRNIKPILSERYDVATVGIAEDDDYRVDMSATSPRLAERYDVVLHAAGKAHVYPKTVDEVKSFYDVNVQGTINLCRALEKSGLPKSFIFISTLDVYGITSGENIDEDCPKNPASHYAISKLQAEEFLVRWADEHRVVLGILGPSLMTGPCPPGNLKAMIRGIDKGFYVNIAGGRTRKSLMMVQDIGHVVPKIEERGGVYNLCDDRHPSYAELAESIRKQLGKKHGVPSIPYWMAWCLAKIGDLTGVLPIDSHRLEQLTKSNTYSNAKAKRCLDWQPMDVIDNFHI